MSHVLSTTADVRSSLGQVSGDLVAKQDWKRLGSLRQLGLSAFVKRQSSREEVVYLNVEYPSDVE